MIPLFPFALLCGACSLSHHVVPFPLRGIRALEAKLKRMEMASKSHQTGIEERGGFEVVSKLSRSEHEVTSKDAEL